jgi:hypothetical protein
MVRLSLLDFATQEYTDMSQVHVETRRKPLRIDENKIRTLEVSGIDEADRVQDEGPVIPSKPVQAKASNRPRPAF